MTLTLRQKFSLIQMTYWCSVCAMFVFIAAYLYGLGYTPFTVGIALALQKVFGFIGQLLWAFLGRTRRQLKRNFILGNILLWLVFIFIYFMKFPWIVIIGIGFSGLFESAMPTLLDTWILKSYAENPEIYGSIRSSASFAFAWFAILMGRWIGQIGYVIMPVASLFLMLLSVTLSISIKTDPIKTSEITASPRIHHSWKNLMKNRHYVSIVLAMLLYGICSLPFNLVLPLLINRTGGAIEVLGYATFASAISQFPMMAFYRRYARIEPYFLIQIAVLLTIMAYVICLTVNRPEAIIVAQVFSGLGFGILLPTLRNMIFKMVDHSQHTLSQSIVDLVQISLAGIIGNTLVGLIAEHFGVNAVLGTFIVLLISAELVLSLAYLSRNEGPHAIKEITD